MNIHSKNILAAVLLISCSTIQAQMSPQTVPVQSIIFQYDEAGNQIFRGYECNNCPSGKQIPETITENTEEYNVIDNDTFWNEIRIYPVPVKDVLTIDWTDEADDLIEYVSIYEHNSINWKFQQQNFPSLNRRIEVDMSGYYMGVYILTFQLKDGRTMSRNITKL